METSGKENPMNSKQWILGGAAAIAAALAMTVPAQAAVKHVDGTVRGSNAEKQTFRIEKQNGNVVKFRVNGSTEFERITGGFAGLEKGLAVEVDFKRTDGGRLARQVEPQGGNGGSGNGADDPAGDDNGGNGADDPAGDDHGGGADDPQPHG
jgi:hypothetical protein